MQFDKNLLAARAGDAILLATNGDLLKAAIDLHAGDKKARSIAQSTATKDVAGILPSNPAA